MAKTFISAVPLLLLLSGSTCQQWSSGPQEHAVLYACANSTLSLPWTVNLGPGDTIENILWFYSGRSEDLIASVTHGNVLTTPTFSGRVQQTTNAGIDLGNMEIMDKGNYSVEVTVRTAGGDTVTLRRSAFVYVTDNLQTSDGQLHVVQQPVAEYSIRSEEFHVVLQCGIFNYPTHPPFEVTWSTPSEQSVDSSSYQDGRFHLNLPYPVEGGSYTCHVPPTPACLRGNISQATLLLDRVDARLAIVEGQITVLRNRNVFLEDKNRILENRNNALETEVNALETRSSALESQVNVLEMKNKALEDLSKKQVSFHTRMASDTHLPSPDSHVIMSNVVYNQGQAYNPSSGVFTAPVNGSYCFIVSSMNYAANYLAGILLMADDRSVARVYADDHHAFETGTGQAVVHLVAGQTVWLKSVGDSYYDDESTAFTGFLVSPDFN